MQKPIVRVGSWRRFREDAQLLGMTDESQVLWVSYEDRLWLMGRTGTPPAAPASAPSAQTIPIEDQESVQRVIEGIKIVEERGIESPSETISPMETLSEGLGVTPAPSSAPASKFIEPSETPTQS
jgi:hypothetical protein